MQLLQLVHRAATTSRCTWRLPSMHRGARRAGGYIGRDDSVHHSSRVLLRLPEHRLQLQRLKRAPASPRRRRGPALAGQGAPGTAPTMRLALRRTRQSVRVSKLSNSSTSRCWNPGGIAARLHRACRPRLPNVSSPRSATRAHRRTDAPGALVNASGRRGTRRRCCCAPAGLAGHSDPDSGLLAYRRISEALADQRWYLSTLRDESAVAKRLMRAGHLGVRPRPADAGSEVIQQYRRRPPAGPKLLDVDPDGVARALIASAGRHPEPAWPSPPPAPCADVNWPGSRRRTYSACSRWSRCAPR